VPKLWGRDELFGRRPWPAQLYIGIRGVPFKGIVKARRVQVELPRAVAILAAASRFSSLSGAFARDSKKGLQPGWPSRHPGIFLPKVVREAEIAKMPSSVIARPEAAAIHRG